MFGIYFVKRGFKVEGIEINLFVVEMVKKNVQINGVDVEFCVGEDKDVNSFFEYDIVVVDFFRVGFYFKFVRKILKDRFEIFVYVFCNLKIFF